MNREKRGPVGGQGSEEREEARGWGLMAFPEEATASVKPCCRVRARECAAVGACDTSKVMSKFDRREKQQERISLWSGLREHGCCDV